MCVCESFFFGIVGALGDIHDMERKKMYQIPMELMTLTTLTWLGLLLLSLLTAQSPILLCIHSCNLYFIVKLWAIHSNSTLTHTHADIWNDV